MIIPNPIRSIKTIDRILASGDFFMLWKLLVPPALNARSLFYDASFQGPFRHPQLKMDLYITPNFFPRNFSF